VKRLYPVLTEAVISGVRQVFEENRKADRVIEFLLKSNPKWGSRDRAFIARSVYDIVRFYRFLNAISGNTENASVIVSAYFLREGFELPQQLSDLLTDSSSVVNATRDSLPPAIAESASDEFYSLGFSQLGERWSAELHALNQKAMPVLRVNTLKAAPSEIFRKFTAEGIETQPIPDVPDALVLHSSKSIFSHPFYKDGFVEMQDASSQRVSAFLQVEPGMRVIDACAGAGGKSLHLAALMKNKGRILSMDIEEYKLSELKRRARRAGVSIIETRVIESSKTIKRLESAADRLLLDVPCTGSGVIRRNPDAKYRITKEFLNRLTQTQTDILNRYPKMLKPGGLMVYATCSVFPDENERQTERFVTNHPDFTLLDSRTILPAESGFDGFYMALLKRQ
jgi:16S rRNA (cytosine967-C5)-methyltransferase